EGNPETGLSRAGSRRPRQNARAVRPACRQGPGPYHTQTRAVSPPPAAPKDCFSGWPGGTQAEGGAVCIHTRAKMPARRQHTALYIPLPAAANPENPYTEATQGWLPLPPAGWAHSGAQDKYPAGPASRSLPSF